MTEEKKLCQIFHPLPSFQLPSSCPNQPSCLQLGFDHLLTCSNLTNITLNMTTICKCHIWGSWRWLQWLGFDHLLMCSNFNHDDYGDDDDDVEGVPYSRNNLSSCEWSPEIGKTFFADFILLLALRCRLWSRFALFHLAPLQLCSPTSYCVSHSAIYDLIAQPLSLQLWALEWCSPTLLLPCTNQMPSYYITSCASLSSVIATMQWFSNLLHCSPLNTEISNLRNFFNYSIKYPHKLSKIWNNQNITFSQFQISSKKYPKYQNV